MCVVTEIVKVFLFILIRPSFRKYDSSNLEEQNNQVYLFVFKVKSCEEIDWETPVEYLS